jgi:1-deoxy-D-xylulose-5-phosphate reductoisomerase
MKNICLLGASGSVGQTTLRVIRQFKKKGFSLHSFSVHSSIEIAKQIIEEFHPKYCIITSKNHELGEKFKNTKILYGSDAMIEIVKDSEVDIVVTAIVGSIGVLPTIEAIKQNKKIAIANKETLVSFGPIIKNLLKTSKSILVPVDSEHNALFQLLESQQKENISKIILTASGGSFRDYPIEKLKSVTVEEALNHPTWKMGKKITVDSAGLVNKGLEVIEAYFLFDIPYEKISVIIHPESIVHGMIEQIDGATWMYASKPDMAFPVAHSLFYPEPTPEILFKSEPKDWKNLNFREVDFIRYPALKLAYETGRNGGTAPAIFNAANEEAVEKFLNREISFLEIPMRIEDALNSIPIQHSSELEVFLEAERLAKEFVKGKK